MSTYHNCYSVLGDVLRGLNDYSTARHNGTSTSGPFDNTWIVNKINVAQKDIYNILMKRIPENFLTSASLTFTNSIATLPWDFGKRKRLVDDHGSKVFLSSVDVLPTNAGVGSDQLFYQKGRTYVLNKAGVTKTYTLYYYTKPRDMHQGTASAGASTSITFASTAKVIADYYNGLTLENITADWVNTISDYTAARVATITGTAAASDYYGTVSELPEEFHHLIAPRAIQLCSMEHPRAQQKPSLADITGWLDMLDAALLAFAGSDSDVGIEELFTDYAGGSSSIGGVNIPGHE